MSLNACMVQFNVAEDVKFTLKLLKKNVQIISTENLQSLYRETKSISKYRAALFNFYCEKEFISFRIK